MNCCGSSFIAGLQPKVVITAMDGELWGLRRAELQSILATSGICAGGRKACNETDPIQ